MSEPGYFIAIESNVSSDEMEGASFGDGRLEISADVNEEWSAEYYSTGWIFDGLKALGIATLGSDRLFEFLTKYSAETIVYSEEADDENIGWDDLEEFESTIDESNYIHSQIKISAYKDGHKETWETADDMFKKTAPKILTDKEIDTAIKRFLVRNLDSALYGSGDFLQGYDSGGIISMVEFIAKYRQSEMCIETVPV